MLLRALLVCRDPDTLRVFRRALGDLEIEVEVSTAASSALERLDKYKFAAIIVDCGDVAGCTEVLTRIQQTPSNKGAIAIALINDTASTRTIFDTGAHFALNKPITWERVSRALRATHGFMVTEHRRYFRHSVGTTAYLSFGVVKQLPCTVTNISDGGMAVTLSEQMSVRWAVDVRFELPGIPEMLEVKGEFAWSDGGGQAGIRFIYVSIESKRRLGKWLSQQIEEPDTGRTPGKANGRRSVPI